MDASRFDQLSRSLTAAGPRRTLIRAMTGLSLTGLGAHLAEESAAGRARKGNGERGSGDVQGEHFRHKKRSYCLNGETIRRYRRKQDKLLAMGATLGRCRACVPGTCQSLGKVCGPVPDGCGGTLACGVCNPDATPSCDAGVCARCAAACPAGCLLCANVIDGATSCSDGGFASCAPCASSADCDPDFPVCVIPNTFRETNLTLPIECGGEPFTGTCVRLEPCAS